MNRPPVRMMIRVTAMQMRPSVIAADGMRLAASQPPSQLLNPVIGAIGEDPADAHDRGPQQRVAPFREADRLAGLAAAVDAYKSQGDQAPRPSGCHAGEFDAQPAAVRGDLLQEQRDNGCG